MESTALQFFQTIVETPRPSGYEQRVQQLVRDYAGGFADRVQTDVHGNVICATNPEAGRRLMFAGHCDQIGMLISHIEDRGFLYAQTIGGWDPQQLIGQRMTVWAKDGPLPAVISRKPIHLLKPEEKDKVVKLEDMWLDIGVCSREEAASLVQIGDPVTLELGFQMMRNGLANSPGMDNASGVWVVMEALRRTGRRANEWGIFSVSTVQEEIGLRGAKTSAFGINPHVAIAVDVTHATDCPGLDKNQLGNIRLGCGPVIFRGPNMNPRVVERLVDVCKQHSIPYQMAAVGRATPNDANELQIARAGVATGLVSIPNRYMHSAVEMISLEDIDHAATLLAQFAVSLTSDDDFVP